MIVKWITDSEVEIEVSDAIELKNISDAGMRAFKHPQNGIRRGLNSYYMRFESESKYSLGAYEFPENQALEQLCITLNTLGFVFWGTFKTEISPFDFMQSLQYRNILKESFRYIQAGENVIKISNYKNA